MEVATIELYQANDAAESFAIKLKEDAKGAWRAQRGFGQNHEKVWTVELQSQNNPRDWQLVEWDAVLDRVVEASTLSDPVLTNFEWPVLQNLS